MTERLSQRLSVVWFTDLVGYSVLVARDQDQAVALTQRFQEAVKRVVSQAEGRVVKFLGDAAMIESPSAEAALHAASAIHAEFGKGIRTGIHLGDVVVATDGDLYGDGVNGAQRIQAEAEPGRIVVSEDVWRRFRNRPAFVFEPLGERRLKGIEPMELFRLMSISAREPAEPHTSAAPVAMAGAAPSIAVLPFVNMSPQADDEYFSDGVTEEVLTLLSRIEGLKVISRTSIMRYKGTDKSMRQIGEELGVATVLEGSVRHSGSRVRITAQLIDAATDAHLWGDHYDRDLEDIFAIQTDVAERIVEALRLRVTRRERSQLAEKPTENLEAYQAYLKGRHFLARRTGTTAQQAIELFRQAVAADGSFAAAWVALAEGLALSSMYGGAPVASVIPEARAAAEKARRLDPRLGEAWASLGLVAVLEWKWDEADALLRRGLELSPNSVTVYYWYAILLTAKGRLEEANALLRRAVEMDPLSIPVQSALGANLSFQGRHEEALEHFRKTMELDPSYAPLYGNVAITYVSQGQFEKAFENFNAFSLLNPQGMPP
ncbi:MAG TPA: tetratricopeptide repeat protein, partial [Gemmatimonadota bacterium]|nr:tetratricopeptide repeat protein [Gemmatimonadota bacterium]